jgi:DNA-binding Lrp family transcriptional regulator
MTLGLHHTAFSNAELAILLSIDLAANKDAPSVAQDTGLGIANVYRILHRLIERRILLGITAQIDFSRIGFTEYAIALSTMSSNQHARGNFVKALCQERSVGWVADVGAPYDCMFSVLSRLPIEVSDLLGRVQTQLKGAILDKVLSIRLKRARFPRGIFGATSRRDPVFELGNTVPIQDLSDIDRAILGAISISHLTSGREIAKSLGISSSTYSRHLSSLHSRGIVLGFNWHMDLSSVGVLQFRILISLTNNSPQMRERLFKVVTRTPAIKTFVECLGSWDYELEADVLHSDQIQNVAATLYEAAVPQIARVAVIPLFRHRKFSSFPVS